MITRELISENFRYKTNEYNARYGKPEEKYTNLKDIEKRINYWKYIFYKKLRLEPRNKVCFYLAHTGIDAFAVIFAAAELSLVIVPVNSTVDEIDLFLHTLPESSKLYQRISARSKRTYHQMDLSEDIINDSTLLEKIATKRPKTDTEILVGISHLQATELLNSFTKITGTVLHTQIFQTNSSILNAVNSLSQDTVAEHIGLGYNKLDQGMPKIILLINEFKIDNVFFNNDKELAEFLKYPNCDSNAIVLDNRI